MNAGWHMKRQHTAQTSVKTSLMNVCVLSTPTLSLLGLFSIKQAVIKVPRVMMK